MELGHNIGHGQWDWMNDPEIHSNTWEWDMAGVSSQWRYSHNYRHHVFTNVLGVGRRHRLRHHAGDPRRPVEAEVSASAAAQPVAGDRLRMGHRPARPARGARARGDRSRKERPDKGVSRTRSGVRWRKDYLLSSRAERPAVAPHAGGQRRGQCPAQSVGVRGDLLRALPGRGREVHRGRHGRTRPNPTGICGRCSAARTSTPDRCWRSPAATCATRSNTTCSPTCPAIATAQIAERVRALCDKYDLPYTTGSFARQFLLSQRTILKLAVPDRFLTATSRRRSGDGVGTQVLPGTRVRKRISMRTRPARVVKGVPMTTPHRPAGPVARPALG